jgi:aminoglycoside phosphotransferase (APT) family kinase protein
MATLGDPLADVGLLLAYWDGLGTLGDSVVASIGPALGFPAGAVLLDRYAARTGTDVASLGWYVAFGYFKIAVILEGIHYRFAAGQTVGAGFDRIGELVPDLVDLGLHALASGR